MVVIIIISFFMNIHLNTGNITIHYTVSFVNIS